MEEALTRLERLHLFTWLPAEEGVYLLMFHMENNTPQVLRTKLEQVTSQLYEALDRDHLSFLSDAVH
jgi:hypothetical protein